MNQIAATGQRWRALHAATRTVQGGRVTVAGDGGAEDIAAERVPDDS
jgi:hypothetical protein